MNSGLSFLECEAPENRVLDWLKHCSPAPKDDEHCKVATEGRANEIHGSESSEAHSTESTVESSTNIHSRKTFGVLNVQCSTSKQNNRFPSTQNKHSKAKRQKSSDADSGCLSSSTSWRLYSHEENKLIIKYIVENDAFLFLKGTLLWKKMEKDQICSRSWQSMKAQFIKKIYPNISEYSLEHNHKEKIIEYMTPSVPKKRIHMEPGQRGWRKNAKYYTVEEDLDILKYILRRKRHLQVHGNYIWQTMEDKQILPGRTWQSMRSRYLNVIRHSLDEYKLEERGFEMLINSKRNGLNFNPPPLPQSPCTNTTSTIGRKTTNQDIRKYAISTSAQLAAKLKLHGKKAENVRNPEEEKEHTNCAFVCPKVSDTDTVLNKDCERNPKINNLKRKDVELSTICKVSKVAPNSEKDDVLSTDGECERRGKSVNEEKSVIPTSISDKSDISVGNSESGNNLQEHTLMCAITHPNSEKDDVLSTDGEGERRGKGVNEEKSVISTSISDKSDISVGNSESGNNLQEHTLMCAITHPSSEKDDVLSTDGECERRGKGVNEEKSVIPTSISEKSDISVGNSESGNNLQEHILMCAITHPNSEKDDVLSIDGEGERRGKGVNEEKNVISTSISDKSDISIGNSESGNKLQEHTLMCAITQDETMKETHTFDNNHSASRNSSKSNEDRNDVEHATPNLVSDSQESIDSVNPNCSDTRTLAVTKKELRTELDVTAAETQSEMSEYEDSFCSRETVKQSSPIHTKILRSFNNCTKCSSDHKLSPSSN